MRDDSKTRAAVWGASAGMIGAPIVGGAVSGVVHGHPWLGIGAGLVGSVARSTVVGSAHLVQDVTAKKASRLTIAAALGTALIGAGAILTYETHR